MFAGHLAWFATLAVAACACMSEARAFMAADAAAQSADYAFRHGARQLYILTHPQCRLSRAVDNETVLQSALAEVAAFRRSINNTPNAALFDAGVADAVQFYRVIDISCNAPEAIDETALRERILNETRAQIAQLQALI